MPSNTLPSWQLHGWLAFLFNYFSVLIQNFHLLVKIDLENCQREGLHQHNVIRKIHQSQFMTLDPDLNENAQGLANEISRTWKPSSADKFVMLHLRGSANIIAMKRSFIGSSGVDYKIAPGYTK